MISLCKQSYTQEIHIVWIVKMCIKLWTMWITLKTGENTDCVDSEQKKTLWKKGKLHFPQGAGKAKE